VSWGDNIAPPPQSASAYWPGGGVAENVSFDGERKAVNLADCKRSFSMGYAHAD